MTLRSLKIRSLVVILAMVAAACGGSDADTSEAAAESNVSDEVVEEAVEEESADDAGETETETETEAEAVDEEAAAADEVEVADETADVVSDQGPIGPPDTLVADCSALPSVPVGLQTGSIMSGGFEYEFQFIVPSGYDGSTPTPMVLDFHGLGSNGGQQALFSGVGLLAETEGFIGVQPTGIPAVGDTRNSWELPQFDDPNRDDVQMVVDLIDFISDNVCIDPGRIYSMGMSNGALFTSELVCDLSERIAAAVSVAGVTHDDSCSPTRAVPYLAFHGIDDATVPFDGGGESSLGPSEFFEQVMPEEFSQFADDFGCTGSEDTSVTAEITLTSYSGCDDDVELGFYAIAGAGHTWPGSLVSAGIESLGVTNTDINATEVAWEFFQENRLPGAVEVADG